MGDVAVQATDVVKRYGATTALNGASFTAASGRITALLGPNGAGKTTAVETCEGFRRPDAGRVRVLGRDPVRDASHLRPRVGVMLQLAGAPTGARAEEWLRLMASFHARPLPVEALLRRLGLRSVARTPVRRLSGGQQQRLSLAAAVIGRPELVFLDEPGAGLDPQARAAAWELVEELRASGVSVVLTTHYMEEAERLADHVVIIDRGAVVAADAPHLLAGAPTAVRFRARTGLDLDSLARRLGAGAAARETAAGRYVVEAPHSPGPTLVAAVATWCADQGVMPEDLGSQRRTLEDVFLELTGRELRE
jgi:ABC-2 type transport system ATP-binding protein